MENYEINNDYEVNEEVNEEAMVTYEEPKKSPLKLVALGAGLAAAGVFAYKKLIKPLINRIKGKSKPVATDNVEYTEVED